MLTRIEASNFKSLGENVTLEMGRLTVLVGINGSGKTNVVDVPRFVAHALREGLDAAVTSRGGMRSLGRWAQTRSFDISIRIDAASEIGEGSFELRLKSTQGGAAFRVAKESGTWTPIGGASSEYSIVGGKWTGPDGLRVQPSVTGLALPLVAADDRFAPLFDELRSVAVYSIFPSVLRSPQPFDSRSPMQEHGENWATTLRELVSDPAARAELVAALNAITSDIEDVEVKQVGNFLSPRYRHAFESPENAKRNREKWFDAGQESDGTLRVTGIITALLQQPAPGLLGIEEPEQTIHPGALPVLYDYLLEASHRTQVVITTHSPDLLDLLDPGSIHVVDRNDGVTRVSALDPSQVDLVRRRLTHPGELLRIEGLHRAAG